MRLRRISMTADGKEPFIDCWSPPLGKDRNEKNLKAKRKMTAVTPFLSASDDLQSFDGKESRPEGIS
jgi:hypothetical protein